MTKKSGHSHAEHASKRESENEVSVSEPEVSAEEYGSIKKEVHLLAESLEQKIKEAAEANDRYLRASADFDNYRKRMQRDISEFRKYANEQLVRELLTVVDNLGLALKHAGESEEKNSGLQQGVELVYKQFRDILEKFGVKSFISEGELFDPSRHDAILQVEKDDVPENTVVQVLQDGYLYHDKVLRPAKVGVSKKPQKLPHIELVQKEDVSTEES
ncbi:MAG: nucleotide exchange factor GrpE [Nitrospirota bacterium]